MLAYLVSCGVIRNAHEMPGATYRVTIYEKQAKNLSYYCGCNAGSRTCAMHSVCLAGIFHFQIAGRGRPESVGRSQCVLDKYILRPI